MSKLSLTETISITTCGGADIKVDFFVDPAGVESSGTTVQALASIPARGVEGEPIRGPWAIAVPAPRYLATVAATGATHYAVVEGKTIANLALTDVTADALSAAFARAAVAAKRLKADMAAARAAEIGQTQTVRRVLCYAPHWGGYSLDQAYEPDASAGYRPEARVRVALPGAEIKLDRKCPSLDAVIARSPYEGSFAGHENTLRAITDADWDVLLAETAALEAAARAKATADRDSRQAELRAVIVPLRALQAFRRYHGDADVAWEREDEQGYTLIRTYADAIEAQGLATAPVNFDMPVHPEGA